VLIAKDIIVFLLQTDTMRSLTPLLTSELMRKRYWFDASDNRSVLVWSTAMRTATSPRSLSPTLRSTARRCADWLGSARLFRRFADTELVRCVRTAMGAEVGKDRALAPLRWMDGDGQT